MIFKIKMEQKISQVVGKIKKDKNVIAIMLFGSYARNKLEVPHDIDCFVTTDIFPDIAAIQQAISKQTTLNFWSTRKLLM